MNKNFWKWIISFSLALAFFCNSWAQPKLILERNVEKKMTKYADKSFQRMRIKGDAYIKIDRKNSRAISDVRSSLKNHFQIFENNDHSVKIGGPQVVILKDINERQMAIPEKILPDSIAKQFSLVSIDTEFTTDIKDLKEKVTGLVFNYQRVYNKRIVRSDKNYLMIAIDGKGFLQWADIAMEDLQQGNGFLEICTNYQESVSLLDSIVKSLFSKVHVAHLDIGRNVDSVMVTSVAEAYCEVKNQGLLLPCFSYTLDLVLEDGSVIFTMMDVPASLQLWRKFDENIHDNWGVNGLQLVFGH